MPHVITQSCCSDGSCVYACPVNCIHPSPDEPGFATAEMLYIDPVACVDCGACVSACPVGAIAPEKRLEPDAAAVHRAERVLLSQDRREAATDLQAGSGDRRTSGSAAIGRAVDGGDRRVGSRGDVRRRRTADPAWGAGQRLRAAANSLRSGACRGRSRSPEHQTGDEAVRPNCPGCRVFVLPQRRGGNGPDARRSAGSPSCGALRRRCAQRSPPRHRRHGPARHGHRHRDGGVDQRTS